METPSPQSSDFPELETPQLLQMLGSNAATSRGGANRCPTYAHDDSQAKDYGLEIRGFCAARMSNNEFRWTESWNVDDFQPLVKDAAISWIDFVVEDFEKEGVDIALNLGFSDSLIQNLLKSSRSGYEDLGDELGILLPAIVVKGFDVKIHRLVMLIHGNLILTLHSTSVARFFRMRRYAGSIMRKLSAGKSQPEIVTLLLIRIINENNSRNFDYLRELEEESDEFSKQLSNPKSRRDVIGPKIYKMKHALITYLGGLWATIDALNSIRYGDAKIISDNPEMLNRIASEIAEVTSMIGLAEHLSDVLSSGLEVVQAIYNNQLQILNNKLAMVVGYMSIIGTALLIPNTLATVLANGMFGFTVKDTFSFLSLILLSTAGATLLMYYAVKKFNLLPKKLS